MSVSQIKTYLQSQFNTTSEVLAYSYSFIFGNDYEKYLKRVKDADGLFYVPGTVTLISQPAMVDDVGLKISSFELRLYGQKASRDDIENIVNNLTDGGALTFDGNSAYVYYQGLQFEDFVPSRDGQGDSRFLGSLIVEVHQILGTIPSNLTKFEIYNGSAYVQIPITSVQYKKDKGVIINKTFNDSNSSTKLVTDTFQIEFPIVTTNAVILDLLQDVLDSSYNEKYTLKWTLTTGITKELDVVIKTGWINYIDNPNPVTFGCLFERALPRKTITVDGVVLPVIQFSVESGTLQSDAIVNQTTKLQERTVTSGDLVITALISYDESTKANAIIAEMNGVTQNTTFTVVYAVGATSYTHSMFVQKCLISALENGDISYQVTFGVKRSG